MNGFFFDNWFFQINSWHEIRHVWKNLRKNTEFAFLKPLLPSWELTYPLPKVLLKMMFLFRLSQGGICIHSLEGSPVCEWCDSYPYPHPPSPGRQSCSWKALSMIQLKPRSFGDAQIFPGLLEKLQDMCFKHDGSNMLFCHPDPCGHDTIWRSYFFKWVETTIRFLFSLINPSLPKSSSHTFSGSGGANIPP